MGKLKEAGSREDEAGEAGGKELIHYAQCPMPNAHCPLPTGIKSK